MPTPMFVILVVLLWLLVGLGAALVFLGRHGYRNGLWYFLGAALGPLFVPIAIERGRRAGGVQERTPRRTAAGDALTVLVGVDGSAESDQAVREAGRLFGSGSARMHLVGVADPDVAEFRDEARQQAWQELLARRAGWLTSEGAPPVLEVLCGQPDRVLLEVADAEQVDVIVVGRRGRGLSHRLLGSVADSLTRHATVPVLLTGPSSPRTDDAPAGRGRVQRPAQQ